MQGICSEIAHAASLFDDSGIDLRFFNSNDSKSVRISTCCRFMCCQVKLIDRV